MRTTPRPIALAAVTGGLVAGLVGPAVAQDCDPASYATPNTLSCDLGASAEVGDGTVTVDAASEVGLTFYLLGGVVSANVTASPQVHETVDLPSASTPEVSTPGVSLPPVAIAAGPAHAEATIVVESVTVDPVTVNVSSPNAHVDADETLDLARGVVAETLDVVGETQVRARRLGGRVVRWVLSILPELDASR